jgi:hypothetical protein
MSSPHHRIALDLLSTANALRDAAQQIALLDQAGHRAVSNTGESATIQAHAPAVADALIAIAGRLAASP